jgi:hypothetical protein
MLEYLSGKASERKHRLFAIACVRRLWHLLVDPRSRDAVEVAARYAEGSATEEALRAAHVAAGQVRWVGTAAQGLAARAAEHVASAVPWVACGASMAAAAMREERAWQCTILRDVVGNPFRPAAFDPRWRTADAVGLARGTYDEGAFDRLPILADALEDAGCTDPDLLGHLRAPGPHVRGCWALDLILGKE